MIVIVNHTLAFSLEPAFLIAIAFFGHLLVEHPVARWVIPVVLVILAIGLWGMFAALNSETRLIMPGLLVFKAVMFSVGAAAIFVVGKPLWVITFGGLVVLHLAIATAINQV